MAPVIYKMAPSPPARAVMMVADIIDAPVIWKDLNLSKQEQFDPEFIKKNPLHMIPFLEDGEFLLSDSHAIAAYLVETYAKGKEYDLYPRPLKRRALVDAKLHFDSGVLFARMQRIIRKVMLHGSTGGTTNEIEELEEAYSILDTYLSITPWVAGDHLTIADVSIAASISCSEVLLPLNEKYTNIASWKERMITFPWYQKHNVPGAEIFATIYKKRLLDNVNKAKS